jgi:hypothetical protein
MWLWAATAFGPAGFLRDGQVYTEPRQWGTLSAFHVEFVCV